MPIDWWLSRWRDLVTECQLIPPDPWLLTRWWAESVLLTLGLITADLLLGSAILKVLGVRLSARLRMAAALTLGGGAMVLAIFALGILRRIEFSWLLGLTLIGGMAGLPLLGHRRGRWFVFGGFRALRPGWRWIPVLALLFVLQSVDWLFPPMDYDATMYHAASARWYVENRRVQFHPGIRFNAHPQSPVLLYTRQMALLGDERTKLINLEFGLVLVLALLHAARRYRVPAAWPVLFAATSPVLCWMSKIEYSDFAMTSWFALGGVLLATGSWSAAGLALGLAASAKLQGLLMVAILGGCVLVLRRLRPAVWIAAGVALFGLPWWVRSWRYTGSPVAPFFLAGSPEPAQLFEVSAKYGLGRDGLAFLRLPWDAQFATAGVFADPYVFGPALLLFLGVALRAAVRRTRIEWMIVAFLSFLAVYTVFWFLTGQVMRYLAATLPILAITASSLLAGSKTARWSAGPIGLLAGAALVFSSTVIRFASLPPVTQRDREVLLATRLPYYASARELQRQLAPGERSYLWFCEEARYHVPGLSFGDWFGDYSYYWVGTRLSGPQEMAGRLRRNGFRYLIVDRVRAEKSASLYAPSFQTSGFAQAGTPAPRGATELYSDGRYVLWRLD